MKVTVFGASGRTGMRVVRELLDRGHEVKAFVHKSEVGIQDQRIMLARGDVLVHGDVTAAVQGADAVISTLGHSRGDPQSVCSEGVSLIIEAMKETGVSRFVCLSAYGAGETRGKGLYAKLLRVVISGRMRDKDRMEEEIRASGLDWTIVRPTVLTDGPRKGGYRAGVDLQVRSVPRVSRADIAEFMVRQVGEKQFVGAAPTVAG